MGGFIWLRASIHTLRDFLDMRVSLSSLETRERCKRSRGCKCGAI